MYYSQCQQDELMELNVFQGFKNGFFMDVGAHNGVSINNTLYFEKNNNWTGINIEPIKKVFDELVINRPNCINLNCAVSNFDGESDFIFISGAPEMLSGLKNDYHPTHQNRLNYELERDGGTSEIIKVPTKRIETICDEYNVKHIHYLSVDVEGGELAVIKSINFDKVFIDIIDFENNYEDASVPIVAYLISKNYIMIHKSNDIFMVHKDSIFCKNIFKYNV
jgi:FkbM family methyltransferase